MIEHILVIILSFTTILFGGYHIYYFRKILKMKPGETIYMQLPCVKYEPTWQITMIDKYPPGWFDQ